MKPNFYFHSPFRSRDKNKEHELLESGAPEYQHIREPLHVRVESHGPCKQVWTNMAAAMEALAPYMKPDETYVPPAPPQWGPGWGYDGVGGNSGLYGTPIMGRGAMRGSMRGRGDVRGSSFTPRGVRGGRGGSMLRGGQRGGGRGEGFGSMDGNGYEDMDMEEGGPYGNGYGQSHSSFGKMLPRGGGAVSGTSRGQVSPRGPIRGGRGGRPY